MNVKNLGVPVYKNELGQEYVLSEDLKLALDSDVYDRIRNRAAKFVADKNTGQVGFDVEWLEKQY